MKKLLFLNIFILILVGLSAQTIEITQQDSTYIIKENTVNDDESIIFTQSAKLDTAEALAILFQKAVIAYDEIGRLEVEKLAKEKAAKAVIRAVKLVNTDTSYTKYSNDLFLSNFVGDFVLQDSTTRHPIVINARGVIRKDGNRKGRINILAPSFVQLKNWIDGETVNLYKTKQGIYRSDTPKLILRAKKNR
jgi:hypothetical protein